MNNPKISVIIPVYNVEKYLSECLGSIVNQTLKDIEVICINDGSTDNSLSILKEYASKDNRIKIIDKENEGQGYARKCGFDIANGKYILFCDSDDSYTELTAFEELYNYIEKVKVDVVIFNHIRNYMLERRIEKKVANYPQKEIFSYLDMDNIFAFYVMPVIKLYSRKFLNNYDDWYFPKKIKYEDMPFHFQIFTRARMAYMDKYFYTYRLRAKSTVTSSITIDRIFDLCKVFKEIYIITKNKCHLNLFFDYFYGNLFFRLSNYQIKSVEVAKYIIYTIKQFDISELFKCKNRNAIFLIKAGLRMSPEDFMEYLNKKQIKNKNKEITKLKEDKQTRDTRIKILNEAIKNRDSLINQKNNEIHYLLTQNNIQDQAIKRLQNSWSYRIGRLFTFPLSLLLDFYRFIRDYNLVKKSSLFDNKYYLSQNEDVKKAKMNPIKHYLQFGWKEGRNPSAKFDGNEYLNKRPDVRVAGIGPLVHFIKFGKDEDLSFFFEKVKTLENENKNLKAKLNNKNVEFEQLNRKKIDINVKLSESTKQIEKLSQKVTDLEKFKNDIEFVYNRGINKEKISYEIEKFLNSSELGITDEKREPELIVSLTSYPARIYEVYYTIFSLLTQSLKPNKIILWLGEEQFPNREKDLPQNLLEFTKYGVEIRYTKNLRSFTKLVPALKEYPNAIIVTTDDDIFYTQDWLEKVYNSWKNNRDCIICHRIAKAEITKDKQFVPFNDWKQPKKLVDSSSSNCLLGYCGVLYSPKSLYKDVLDEGLFMNLAPNTDDIWFWAMAVLNDTKIKLLEDSCYFPIYVNPEREKWFTNESTLFQSNVGENKNQIQFDNIINHYPKIMEKLLEEKT